MHFKGGYNLPGIAECSVACANALLGRQFEDPRWVCDSFFIFEAGFQLCVAGLTVPHPPTKWRRLLSSPRQDKIKQTNWSLHNCPQLQVNLSYHRKRRRRQPSTLFEKWWRTTAPTGPAWLHWQRNAKLFIIEYVSIINFDPLQKISGQNI